MQCAQVFNSFGGYLVFMHGACKSTLAWVMVEEFSISRMVLSCLCFLASAQRMSLKYWFERQNPKMSMRSESTVEGWIQLLDRSLLSSELQWLHGDSNLGLSDAIPIQVSEV